MFRETANSYQDTTEFIPIQAVIYFQVLKVLCKKFCYIQLTDIVIY